MQYQRSHGKTYIHITIITKDNHAHYTLEYVLRDYISRLAQTAHSKSLGDVITHLTCRHVH